MLKNTNLAPYMPFGLKIEAQEPGVSLGSLDVAELRALVLQNRVLVLRGFAPLGREAFQEYAATWGELLLWNFGAILDVVVAADAQNYLFTHGSVPHHWDGAFADTVPFLQIFQCLAAPGDSGAPETATGSANLGGETVFCDTTRVWNAASPQLQASWAQTTVGYRTDKLAHYGGQISAPLVSHHLVTGETTLRFAEPHNAETAPLNPLFLEVQGNSLDALLQDLQPRLYADEYCYVHEWREGDFVIADNHALLHARKAFAPGASRHLQRIHVK